MITRDEILKGLTCPPEYEANLQQLLESLNRFRSVYGKPMIVTSGLRSPAHNQAVGGRSRSAHLSAQAVDILDKDKSLATFCLNNEPLLIDCGLWIEDPRHTPPPNSSKTPWVHFQIRPASRRIFLP
jgi:hypothetical protein